MSRWLGICVYAGLAFSTGANAELWAAAGSGNNLPMLAAVDTTTFIEVDGRRLVWAYYAAADENGFVKSVNAFRNEYDCKRREAALRKWTRYSPSTLEVEEAGTPDDKFNAPNPGTLAQWVLEFVCSYDIDKRKPAPSPNFAKMPENDLTGFFAGARDYFASQVADRAKTEFVEEQ